MTEETKKRYSAKDYKEQVDKIINLTTEIVAQVNAMPNCTAKKSYLVTIGVLVKKNTKNSQERNSAYTNEEKAVMLEALKKFREQSTEEKISPIPSDEDVEKPASAEQIMSKKKNKKVN